MSREDEKMLEYGRLLDKVELLQSELMYNRDYDEDVYQGFERLIQNLQDCVVRMNVSRETVEFYKGENN